MHLSNKFLSYLTTTNNEYVSEKVKDSYTIVVIEKYKSTRYWAQVKEALATIVG